MENKPISKNTFSEPQGEYDEIFPDGEVIKSIRDEARPSLQNTINRQALLCRTNPNMPPRAGLVVSRGAALYGCLKMRILGL